MSALRGRVVVVSPHLDDAVLSLGATIARAVRSGAAVEVLTVLAGDPGSDGPPGRWDALAGFGSSGEAARVRREEDRRACAVLGAIPTWLPFPDKQYGRPVDDDAVHAALETAVAGADLVLVPGFPLAHSDHAWVAELVLSRGAPAGAALYVEWPYAYVPLARGERPAVPVALEGFLPSGVEFLRSRVGFLDLVAKWRAVRGYASQVRLLGTLVERSRGGAGLLLRAERRVGGETIGWPSRRPRDTGRTMVAS